MIIENKVWSTERSDQLGRYYRFVNKKYPEWHVCGIYLLVAVCLFEDGELPNLYLIPTVEWHRPNALLVGHDYEGLKSKPEWGLNLSHKNLDLLEQYKF